MSYKERLLIFLQNLLLSVHVARLLDVRHGHVTECEWWNGDRSGKCHIQAWLVKTATVVPQTPLLGGWKGGHPMEGTLEATP